METRLVETVLKSTTSDCKKNIEVFQAQISHFTCEEFFAKYGHEFGHYFRFLYNFYRYIDENSYTKKHHEKVLRSYISDYELLLLFYNGQTVAGKNFGKYFEKYAIFDNLPCNKLIAKEHLMNYPIKAYGEMITIAVVGKLLMKRLIKSGLMFGNLIHVDSPALVERYNRALKHLTGKTTQLTDFHIDISGYSPEVGHELDDHLYLNHAGVNRQFILLLDASENRAAAEREILDLARHPAAVYRGKRSRSCSALTARDAVAGELVNSVYDMSSPARLFDIRKITIEADTTNGAIRQAQASWTRWSTVPERAMTRGSTTC